jgi:hypothetical protein
MNLRQKSRTTSAILTFLFGPLGVFYSSVAGAIVLILVAIASAGTVIGPILCWIAAIIWGDHTVRRHNESVDQLLNRSSDDSGDGPQ